MLAYKEIFYVHMKIARNYMYWVVQYIGKSEDTIQYYFQVSKGIYHTAYLFTSKMSFAFRLTFSATSSRTVRSQYPKTARTT